MFDQYLCLVYTIGALGHTMQIISRQEKVKSNFRNCTLHEWMCFESENIVKHNWTDIAVHDRKILNKMRPGDTRLWIISEVGSNFLPMYCKLFEKERQEESEYDLSLVEIHMLRFLKEDNFSKVYNKVMRNSFKFYFITKGDCDYNYSVVETTFDDVVNLAFCGKANFLLNES